MEAAMRPLFDPYAQRIPLKSGNEYDAFTPWRRCVFWHAHEREQIKRTYHHRWRRLVRQFLKLIAKTP